MELSVFFKEQNNCVRNYVFVQYYSYTVRVCTVYVLMIFCKTRMIEIRVCLKNLFTQWAAGLQNT